MPEIIREAKTVESAIAAALKELGCTKEEIEIEVIQEPVKGIFGMTKMAKVRVNYNKLNKNDESNLQTTPENNTISLENLHEAALQGQKIIRQLLSFIGIQNVKIKTHEEADTISLDIYCDSEGLLIGRHGQTLSALQYLVNRITHHNTNKKIRYVVDVGGYRVRHKTILEKMAKRIAQKVAETKQEEQLKAMSAYDRRIIHLCIKDNPVVTTYSLGEGNYRRVVIAPKEKTEKNKQ